MRLPQAAVVPPSTAALLGLGIDGIARGGPYVYPHRRFCDRPPQRFAALVESSIDGALLSRQFFRRQPCRWLLGLGVPTANMKRERLARMSTKRQNHVK